MAKLGIVTVLFESNDLLEGFLRSISVQEYKDYELFLVDNSPSEKTDVLVAQLQRKFPVTKLIHIKNASNLGAAEGNNIGIRQAVNNGDEIILLTNTDIVLDDPKILSKAIQLFESTGEKIIVPKIYTGNKEKVWMAGAGFSNTLAKGKHYGYQKEDSEKYGISRHVKYAPTTFMFIKKEVFNSIGYLDAKYFAYFEDSDFIFRSNKKGYKILYYPELHVEHLVSYTTGGASSVFAMYYAQRGRIYFTRKNLPVYKYFVTFPYILAISFFRLFTYTAAQRKATIRGTIDGFKLSLI